MKPKNNYNKGCPDALGTNCVTWQGDDIKSLGICYGDTITEAMHHIATQVCKLTNELDLSSIDLSCIIDLCGDCVQEKNLKTILQLMLENDCTLKTLIDNINNDNSGTTPTINLNMKCLKKFDDFGNEIVQDLNQTLQSIVNQVCTDGTNITVLQNQVQDLQDQIDNIDITPAVQEVTVTTCIAGPRPVSQALVRVADDYCNYKTAVGTVIEIQQAISQQCPNLNSSLGATEGWIQSPQDMAQSMNNLWIAYCNALSRIELIENNCCKITCKDIILQMIITPNSDGDAITVKFASSIGTFIPTGFTDNGSIITITDQKGNQVQYPIVVSQDGTQGPFSFVGLDTSAPLTVSVNAKLQSESLGCEKCISKQFTASSSCPVCAVTGSGDTGSVTITYQI